MSTDPTAQEATESPEPELSAHEPAVHAGHSSADLPAHDAGDQPADRPAQQAEPGNEAGSRLSTLPRIGLIRTVWLAIVALSMIAAFFSGGQDTDWDSHASSWDSAVDRAASTYSANELMTGGAPQQSVANGWHTNDLLEVQVRVAAESSEILHAEYRTLVLLILLLGIGLLGDRALAIWDRRKSADSPSPRAVSASNPLVEAQPDSDSKRA